MSIPDEPDRAAPARAERAGADLERDLRRERRLAWQELACLLFVAAFLVVRARWLT